MKTSPTGTTAPAAESRGTREAKSGASTAYVGAVAIFAATSEPKTFAAADPAGPALNDPNTAARKEAAARGISARTTLAVDAHRESARVAAVGVADGGDEDARLGAADPGCVSVAECTAPNLESITATRAPPTSPTPTCATA